MFMMRHNEKMIDGTRKTPERRMDRKREKGVVLISVLWICALIMWFALQIGVETRLQGDEEVHMLRRSQAFYLAVGGCYEALAHMGSALSLGFDAPPESNWQPNGQPHVIDYQTGQALVIVESENLKVNVNKASQEQLKTVLEKAGMQEDAANEMADRIRDFIDQDDIPGLKGAEKDRYEDMGLPYQPFNGPLTSLDQMLLIPGITQQLFYGYGIKGDLPAQENEAGIYIPPLLPRPDSLFQMLTIYGKNIALQDNPDTQEFIKEHTTWENGGIYRILSTGMTSGGTPAVVIWLTVRFAPETEEGYEVLYRKIL
ncbi:hypothetical protein DAMNIGENAA_22030 [Desulforhabdus amnigena]|uniref:T2SS protein K first SAM-like domain-containing protein n=2 Tax=Desulforhabdus amnigena TaxID=40218 RepID=A0A9W6D2Q1_9BACT|nr:hypothetical protein DAMNIGENAA_22030 [Desulforhabdus amnigena]